jgi:hypothetical protein
MAKKRLVSCLTQEILNALTVNKEISIQALQMKLEKDIVFNELEFGVIIIELIKTGKIRMVPGWAKFTSAEENEGVIIKRPGIFCEYIEKV